MATSTSGTPVSSAVISGFTVGPSLLADHSLCTIQTCPLVLGNSLYLPSLPGNAFYAAWFGILLLVQLILGYRYRTWGYAFGMFCGLVIEAIGYIGRIMEHSNPFTDSPFLIYIVCLTIGPAFLSGSIYLCLARIVVIYGEHMSRFKPRTYTITFMSFDFVSLILQAAGGAIASIAGTASLTQTGINVMIAGLAWQVVSLFVFAVLCGEFAWRVRQNPRSSFNEQTATLRGTFKFRAFLGAIALATVLIFTRSCFRCAELQGGFDGTLANNQVLFMVLEGAMIATAALVLTVAHPGIAFQGQWADAAWHLRKSKNKGVEVDHEKAAEKVVSEGSLTP